MVCGRNLKGIWFLLVLVLLGLGCLHCAYSQDETQSEEKLLDELERTLKRAQDKINLLEQSLEERKAHIERLEELLKKSESALHQTQVLLQAQEKSLSAGSRLFSDYEKLSERNEISAGFMGATVGVVVGFLGAVVGMYFIGK